MGVEWSAQNQQTLDEIDRDVQKVCLSFHTTPDREGLTVHTVLGPIRNDGHE